MRLAPGLEAHLRGLADELLVKDFPGGAPLTRAECELLATVVSAGNDCFYCMDSHGAFRERAPATGEGQRRRGARGPLRRSRRIRCLRKLRDLRGIFFTRGSSSFGGLAIPKRCGGPAYFHLSARSIDNHAR
jgi:AhpD family alkylhydroperoxidase